MHLHVNGREAIGKGTKNEHIDWGKLLVGSGEHMERQRLNEQSMRHGC